MTISKTHSVNLLGLHTAMQQLNVGNAPNFALFYFVVPTEVYPVFANPTPVAEGGHNALPNNVHFLVLEMPLPDTVGGKRKVRPKPARLHAMRALHAPLTAARL
jgi:hypothetical protein